MFHLINKENEETEAESQRERKNNVQNAHSSHIFEKAGFENIVKCHDVLLLLLPINSALGVF